MKNEKRNKKIKLAPLEVPVMNAGASGGPAPAIIIAIIMLVARIRYAPLSETIRHVA